MVGEGVEFEFFEFGRHVLSEIEIELLMGDSVYTVELVFVVEDDEQVVMRVIVNFTNYFFFMLDQILREYESITIFNRVFVIFELIN